MAIAIKLPDMGTNVEECKVLSWKVKQGDAVKRGDVLAEIETDKAVAELESTAEGILLQCRVPAGEMAHTGDVLAYVGQANETIPAEASSTQEQAAATKPVAAAVSAPTPPRVSPIVRNLAAKLGVDLQQVQGTGAGGVITREDVQHAQHATAETHEVANGSAATEQLSRRQAAVARAVQKSWQEIPHLAIAASIDMSRAIELRETSAGSGSKISFDAIFLKGMALAGARHRLFLAKLEGESIVRSRGVHIALAVGFGDELYLPVIRNIEGKSLAALDAEIRELAAAVKSHALKADQLTGATMALSNLGMFPIDSFDAIIFPEHSSILTVGSVHNIPVAISGTVAIRPTAVVKLAADHRLINGRAAAEFITTLKELIEAGRFD